MANFEASSRAPRGRWATEPEPHPNENRLPDPGRRWDVLASERAWRHGGASGRRAPAGGAAAAFIGELQASSHHTPLKHGS